jgi:hypothetical protein
MPKSAEAEPTSVEQQCFQKDVIVNNILQFVGPGQWAYMVVDKRIGSMYEILLKKTPRENLMQDLQVTTFANAVTSMSRLQYALSCGMDPADGMNYCSSAEPHIKKKPYYLCRAVGGYATDREVVLAAKAAGMPWHTDIVDAAAERKQFEMIRWLHAEQECPWNASVVSLAAATAGDLEMLQFMWNRSDGKWPAKENFKHSIKAAKSGNIAMLDWLLAQGLLTEVDSDEQTYEEYQASNSALAAQLAQTPIPGITAEMIAGMQQLFNADPNSTRFNRGQGELYTAAVLGCSTQVCYLKAFVTYVHVYTSAVLCRSVVTSVLCTMCLMTKQYAHTGHTVQQLLVRYSTTSSSVSVQSKPHYTLTL